MSIYNLNNKVISKFTGLNVIIIVIVSLFFFRNSIYAQDIHFSQILSTPVITNPANTGIFDGQLRVTSDYRNQWASIGVPFNTFYTAIDKKLVISNQLIGIGGLILHDQSSGNSLTADKVFLSLSFSKFYKNHQFVIGIQPGLAYDHFSANGITFGSQYDPANSRFDPNLPSQENNLLDNNYYFDLNIGFLWQAHIKNALPVAGISIEHINRPVESFMSNNDSSRMPIKYTFHSQITLPIIAKYDLTPCLLFSHTPGAREFLIGAVGGYSPDNFFIPVKKLYAINLYRLNPERNIDAIIIGGGVKFSKLDVGISYDINVSSLHQATNFNGAFEISLIYTGSGSSAKSVVEPCSIY